MIRKSVLSDTDKIMDIWLKSNVSVHDFIPKDYWLKNYNDVKSAIEEAEVYVYVDDKTNDIVAFIGLNCDYIEGLFVKENERSKGIGKALLDCAKGKKSKLTLDVYAKNIRAIRFYEREHFVVEKRSDDNEEYTMIWKVSTQNNF